MTDMEEKVIQWNLIESSHVNTSEVGFWKALDIYTKRPHIINRRLIGAETVGHIKVESNAKLSLLRNFLLSHGSDKNLMQLLQNEFELLDDEKQNECHPKNAIIKKLLPKNSSTQCSFEIVTKDAGKNYIRFLNISSKNDIIPNFSYAFSFENNVLKLWIEEDVSCTDTSLQWIISKLMPKLIKWMENIGDEKPPSIASLSLVSVSDYTTLYTKLKEKYGKELVQIWPENTDPLKFVYEDIGIATYLLLLWAGKPKQRFVDLGCGNGLLVHILNSEGHLGIGYDLRPRKIWSLYPPSTRLEVQTIIPSSDTLFPEADWLIGNHSDELTVWIPVMAARSSYSCNFFLLPCCPYEFNGKKYCRVNTSVSQYSDFLSYVEKVCEECGIMIGKDKLRIPSTKRICFVGSKRTYPLSEWKTNLERLHVFVDSKCSFVKGISEKEENASLQFKPRDEERVRNCTQIQLDVRERIVNLVVEQLLAKRRSNDDGWTYGGIVEICTLAKIIPSDLLKKLKSECGGLQTLLKNYHYIFKVQSGKVEFRVPSEKSKNSTSVWKKKPCWFYNNHPNSCPLSDNSCSFIH